MEDVDVANVARPPAPAETERRDSVNGTPAAAAPSSHPQSRGGWRRLQGNAARATSAQCPSGRRPAWLPEWVTASVVVLCVLWIIGGTITGIFLRQHVIDGENNTIKRETLFGCTLLLSDLNALVSSARNIVDALQATFYGGTNSTPSAAHFALAMRMWTSGVSRQVQQMSGIEQLLWIPVVTNATRASFEERVNASILDITSTGLHRASPRSVYFPIEFASAIGESDVPAHIIVPGLDFLPLDGHALWTAVDGGSEGGGRPFFSEAPTARGNGVVGLFVPYYGGAGVPPTVDERRNRLRGFGYVCFNASRALRGSMCDALGCDANTNATQHVAEPVGPTEYQVRRAVERQYVDAVVADVGVVGGASAFDVFVWPSRFPYALGQTVDADYIRKLAPEGVVVTLDAEYAGRKWLLMCTPTPAIVSWHRSTYPTVIIASFTVGGVLACAATCLAAKVSHASTERQNAVAQARDEELRGQQLAHDMFTYVNHGIRNPLNALSLVMGLLDVSVVELRRIMGVGAKDDAPDAASLQKPLGDLAVDIRTAQECGQLILSVVNDVLDIRKIEEGHLVLSPRELEVDSVIGDVVRMVRPKLNDGVELSVNCPPSFRVVADEDRLKQLLLNYLSNAAKFTDKGEIVVECAPCNENGNIRFSVRDTGRGVHDDERPYIFAPWSLTAGAAEGGVARAGLGLFLCDRLARAMGGSVGFESQFGDGATFWFELPIVREEALAAMEDATLTPNADIEGNVEVLVMPEHQPASREVSGAFLSSCRSAGGEPTSAVDERTSSSENTGDSVASLPHVARPVQLQLLVVDDVAVNRVVLKRHLEVLGHTVVTADDGLQAVDAARRECFDGVLIDVQMPVMDGREASSSIRAFPLDTSTHATSPNVVIIGITADVTPDDVRACEQAGMDTVASKPVRREHIAHALKRFTDPKTGRLSREQGRRATLQAVTSTTTMGSLGLQSPATSVDRLDNI